MCQARPPGTSHRVLPGPEPNPKPRRGEPPRHRATVTTAAATGTTAAATAAATGITAAATTTSASRRHWAVRT
jgi:hypothetical protein